MGIYDREYYREDEPGGLFSGRSMVTNLILVNVAVFIAEQFFRIEVPNAKDQNSLVNWFGLPPNLFVGNWRIWSLLTYGFLHDQDSVFHVGFNMFGLWL